VRQLIIHSTSIIPEPQHPASEFKLDRVLVVDDTALNREIIINIIRPTK
jgi:hypothetical protein